MANIIPFRHLTGGTDDSYLDYHDGDALLDGQWSLGCVGGVFLTYVLDDDFGGTADGYYSVAPVTNPGTKRWRLQSQGGAVSHVKSKSNAGQSIASASYTTLIHEDEVYDALGEYNTSTGIFTATYEGKYHVHIRCLFATTTVWSAGHVVIAKSYIDGVEDVEVDRILAQTGFTNALGFNAGVSVNLTAGQTLQIKLYQNTGATAYLRSDSDVYNWITIDRMV